MKLFIAIVLLGIAYNNVLGQKLYSPDLLNVVIVESKNNQLVYSVLWNNKTAIEQSHLGLILENTDFFNNLSIVKIEEPVSVKDSYSSLNAKKSHINYLANRYIIHCQNAQLNKIDIIFQLSKDGVAFRYYFPEKSNDILKITEEKTSYNFEEKTIAWLQPMSEAQSGWEHCNPAYEEFYEKEIPVGESSPTKAGWVYPALFKTSENVFIAITEAGLDGSYCGTRLKAESPLGEYSVGFPQSPEVFSKQAALNPESATPWYTPWRVICLGTLKTVTESTLGTDLALPEIKIKSKEWIQQGISSWSWILLKDNSINYDTTKLYIDYASKMKWSYCLIDVNWDTTIGYKRIEELAKYAKTKNVGLILWYNSAGSWNTTPYHPRNLLLDDDSRRKEFQRIKSMGIAGVKIDFFAGDGQSMIKYYLDILKDAAEIGLMINFHGATLPRGWQRTYPNLMTTEAIKGFEMVTFSQESANEQPRHTTTIPFTRNLFDPMDFTPMVLDSIPNIKRVTTKGFELALPVLFLSGIQHLAESPYGMAKQNQSVIEYLQNLPTHWDDTKFIDGYPGKFIILARKSGKKWYVIGVNSDKTEKNYQLDCSFITKKKGYILEDISQNQVIKKSIFLTDKTTIYLMPNGGFVAVF